MALTFQDEHIGTTVTDLMLCRDRGRSPFNDDHLLILLVGRRPQTRKARIVAIDLDAQTGALTQRDAMETPFPVQSAFAAEGTIEAENRDFLLAVVDDNKRVIIQGLAATDSGQIAGKFSFDTGISADEVRLKQVTSHIVLAARQGGDVQLSIWRQSPSTVQPSADRRLFEGLAGIGTLTGREDDLTFAAPLAGGGVRLESSQVLNTHSFEVLASAVLSDDLIFMEGAGFGADHVNKDHFRRIAVVQTNQGPTAVRTGLLGLHHLLVGGGTLRLKVFGHDPSHPIDGPTVQNAEVTLDGWFGIAFEAAVTLQDSILSNRIFTAQSGVSTYRKTFASDRGKPLLRLIEWEMISDDSGHFDRVAEIRRRGHVEIGGRFRAVQIAQPAASWIAVAMIDEDDRLRLRSYRIED